MATPNYRESVKPDTTVSVSGAQPTSAPQEPVGQLQSVSIDVNPQGGFSVTCVHEDGETVPYDAPDRASLDAYLTEKLGPPVQAQPQQATGDEPV